VITLDTDPDDFEWTTELGTGSEDTAMRFGKREFVPNPLAKRLKISKKLLRNSTMPIENIVRDRLAYKLGITLEKNYLTGNGAKKPLGVYIASNDGIPTSRATSRPATPRRRSPSTG
jgi:HK97 family phage major capsid protein